MRSVSAVFCIVVAFSVVVLGSFGPAVGASEDAAKPEFYVTRVKPVFDENCARCHQGENHRGGFNMDTRESMLKGGHDGPALVPWDPANSMLAKLIRHQGPADDPMDMPPKRPKLSDADISVVEQWIKAGAVMAASSPTR